MLQLRSYIDIKHFISCSEYPLSSIKNKTLLYQLKPAQDILNCISYFAASQDLCISFSLIHQPPTWRTRVSLFVWVITLDVSSMGGPTSSHTTASIGLWIMWPHKPHHYIKVEIPSVGSHKIQILFVFESYVILNLNGLYMLCIHMYCDLNNIFVHKVIL